MRSKTAVPALNNRRRGTQKWPSRSGPKISCTICRQEIISALSEECIVCQSDTRRLGINLDPCLDPRKPIVRPTRLSALSISLAAPILELALRYQTHVPERVAPSTWQDS